MYLVILYNETRLHIDCVWIETDIQKCVYVRQHTHTHTLQAGIYGITSDHTIITTLGATEVM